MEKKKWDSELQGTLIQSKLTTVDKKVLVTLVKSSLHLEKLYLENLEVKRHSEAFCSVPLPRKFKMKLEEREKTHVQKSRIITFIAVNLDIRKFTKREKNRNSQEFFVFGAKAKKSTVPIVHYS